MSIKHLEEYRDPDISRAIIDNIKKISRKKNRLMEVCGTHTMSIFRSGIRTLLPDTISLLSGPGCPVCVTDQKEIDAFIELAKIDDVIIATFGDLLKVPGTKSSLQSFATTAPTRAAYRRAAKNMSLQNYFLFSAHKLVPPALDALMKNKDVRINGFILPGHVSVMIGTKAYLTFFEKHKIPCAITGFEPADILQAILSLVRQIEDGNPGLENLYQRAVTFDGNEKAINIMQDIFETVDTAWRGIGIIPESGLKIKEEFSSFDAEKMFEFDVPDAVILSGCSCGEILQGIKTPPECALYKKICTPINPVGPCMVSSEGTCAAYYRYNGL
jgi:hydrogenase expression/formation protein HypD